MNHWVCTICDVFQAITLRDLVSHYNRVHANESNFRVVCNVEECPASFTKFNSFYKHIKRSHQQAYERSIVDNVNEVCEHNASQVFDITCNVDPDTRDGAESSSSEEFEITMDCDKDADVDIKKSAASFLLKVKERNKIPQVAMESVMDCTRTLITQVVGSVKTKVLDAIDCPETRAQVSDLFHTVPDPFDGIETDALQSKYIKENFNYVEPKQITLGKILARKTKKGKMQICEKEETFVYIPILESLKQMLSNKRISSLVLKKPKCCAEGVFHDVHDGYIYQNDEYFDEHENALCIVLYHDELEVCNPLGSNAGTHKLDMYYYTIANLCPKYRSKRCAVRLFAIANADLVKKYGIDCIMQPLVDDLKTLYVGYNMNINGVNKVIYGKVLMCTGDTLGQHYWGGFKEGVGAAFQKCRHCQCAFNEMQSEFLEEGFILRTKETYIAQCEAIEKAPTVNVQKDLQTTYGITQRSVLCQLPTFDVTKQLPQDIMHTVLEGVVQYEVRLVLQHYIQSGVTTLSQINGAITSIEYGYSEVSDKPGLLKDTVFNGDERYKLKKSAAEARLFLRLLPFILGPLIDNEDQHYSFLMELIEIVQIIFSPVIRCDTINKLRTLIAEHLSKFKDLFPNINILPKQHYLVHIPTTIQMLGPMVRSSCFSFESAHSYYKELARKQNFKNLALSLARRDQFNECCNFGDPGESPSTHPLFCNEINYGVLKKVNEEACRSLRETFDSHGLLPAIPFSNVYKVSWVQVFGTKYAKSALVAIDVLSANPNLPIFGAIVSIWLIKGFVYFDVQLYETICFEFKHQAYRVKEIEEACTRVCPYESLLDFNVFHPKKDQDGNHYVPVKYDLRDLMIEHVKGENPLH